MKAYWYNHNSEGRINLPEDDGGKVVILLTDQRGFACEVRVSLDKDGKLYVNADNSLAIELDASNCFHVAVK